MIRINLLPHREIKRAARRRQFNYLLLAALVAGVAVVAVGYVAISARLANQEGRNTFLEAEIGKLDKKNEEISKIKGDTQALMERKQVVETLQATRTEAVHLFDDMIRLLPEGLYLKSLKQSGNDLEIAGYTQSSARVSTLMRNLEESPWYEKPELVEIKAATINNLRANEFTLKVRPTMQQTETDAREGRS